jgi:hypothetical protein
MFYVYSYSFDETFLIQINDRNSACYLNFFVDDVYILAGILFLFAIVLYHAQKHLIKSFIA